MKMFKPTPNKSTLISNEVLEKHRYNLSLNGQKLLYGLAQSIDHTVDMFPTIEFDIHGIFDFLDIAHRNDRYQIVADAVTEIQENPLKKRSADGRKWLNVSWINTSGFDEEDSQFVKIKFNDDAKPYLLHLSGYVKIHGKYICSLNSTYATWLYPVMKMVLEKYYGKHEIPIQRLKEFTFTDDPKTHATYNDPTRGNSAFISRCLGLSKSRKTKSWTISEDSPLAEISDKTDIIVTAEVLKNGGKYDRVRFYVQSKKPGKKSPVDKSKYVSVIPSSFNPTTRFPLKEVFQTATEAGMTVDEYCKKAGYYIKDNWVYKKFTEPKQGKKRTGGKLQISNAIGQLSLLDQTNEGE